MIVSNATPLIAFARIGELTLLERIVHHVTLPETVWSEVRAVTTYPGAEAIGQATWIAVRAVTSVPAELLALLDRGEAEVIALAEELRALEVLLDERAVRAIAITRGLPVIGTAGLLVRVKDRGFIPAVRPFLSRMQAAGVRYSQRFIETLLERFPVACATPLAMGSLTPCSLAVKHGASKWEPLQGNWENNMRGHHTCIQCDNAHAAA